MSSKTYVFGAPGRYVQGAGAINRLGEYLTQLGGRVLVIGGKRGLDETRTGRTESFKQHGIRQFEEDFGGETCDSEIESLVKKGKNVGCDIITACGGGKVIDAVKAAAETLEVPAVIVPTIASNDAPCSALSVIYNEDGSFSRLMALKRSPELVLVDTEIIARAPVRQLVSGMGDALATWFEAEACYNSGALNNFGGSISETALALAKLCLETLKKYGRESIKACERKTVTPALDKIIEANVLLSGLGFECGGVAVAHAIAEAFSAIPEMHGAAHGEKVAFGLYAHLLLNGAPEETIREVYSFSADVGLPLTLRDLGCTDSRSDALKATAFDAAAPGRPSHNLRAGITGGEIYEAVMKADEIGGKLRF